jgi:hypothetical protein
LCSLNGAASSPVSIAYVFVCVRISTHFPYLVIYAARIVRKHHRASSICPKTQGILEIWGQIME